MIMGGDANSKKNMHGDLAKAPILTHIYTYNMHEFKKYNNNNNNKIKNLHTNSCVQAF